MAFALPVGGVYASADSPSKYLDRLTTVNTSVNREDGGVSSGLGDEPTVSHAVRTSHGVILNTVVRNANRLEYSMRNTDDSNVQTVADTTTGWAQWGTVGWTITDDGVLKIRPWEGDTGTTGPVLNGYSSVPWYNQRSKIKKVESTGTIVLNANSAYLFYYCSNLTDISGLASWNVSNVTDMNGMFSYCSSLTALTGLSGWNVSKVTNMYSMFYYCYKLTDLTALANWKVSNVTSMNYMFGDCSSLTDLTALANWTVSNVKDMSSMFWHCSRLTNLTGLSGWNVSNVTNMFQMFYGCSSLTALTGLASWNVSKVTDMGTMFWYCSRLTDLTALKDWNVSNVTDMDSMFKSCSSLQKVGIPSIANGGQKLVANASAARLPDSLGSRIITEDLQLGPYTWDELNTEMTTNPEGFTEGHVWVGYTPSWMVTYHANGGVGSMPGSMVSLSSPLALPEASFLRLGYNFIGWTTQPDSVSATNPLMKPGQIFDPSDKTEGKKHKLYAQWEKIVTSIQFKFTKLMDGNVPDDSEHFQFELFSVSENKVIQTTVNNGASVQFKPITYDKVGTYKYYVRETPSNASNGTNSNPNLDYDDHRVEVVVTITEENDPTSPSRKKLTATAQITGDTVFRNDSKPASLDITKTVTGVTDGMSETHKDREFTFNVNLLDRDNQPVSGKTYPTTITNNSGSGESSSENTVPSTSSITFDAEGNATVKLKAGSKLTINGIPAYYKYTITETNIPAGYENTTLTNSSGILGANSHVTVDAVNHYTAAPANVSLQAGKILLAPGGLNQSVNNGEFRFTLCQVASPPIEPELEPNAESCTGVSEASNDGNGLITFPQLTYNAPGTYQYQIREVKGDTLDMDYDSMVYTVTVTVTDDGEGRLVAGIKYRNDVTGDVLTPSSMGTGASLTALESLGVPVFVNRNHVANRLPVTGGTDIVYASIIIAILVGAVLITVMNRRRSAKMMG